MSTDFNNIDGASMIYFGILVLATLFLIKYAYPNNMVQNGIEGIYTDMLFEVDGKYRYVNSVSSIRQGAILTG